MLDRMEPVSEGEGRKSSTEMGLTGRRISTTQPEIQPESGAKDGRRGQVRGSRQQAGGDGSEARARPYCVRVGRRGSFR